MISNILLNTDSYKASHYLQMPPFTTHQNSYIESRGGKWDETVFFGLQMFLKEYLTKPFTLEDINEAEDFWKAHGEPFNREGWKYILKKYHGYLPLSIEAVSEGTVVPTSNVLVQAWNNDGNVPWLTSYLETALLRAVWYPTTVATNSFQIKKVIYEYLKKTSETPDTDINFKLHDFGARGVSSFDSAGIGGAAHLVNFMGTDTVTGILYARKYYHEPMAGYSIPASEHSTITSWGRLNEKKAYENMLDQFGKPGAMLACVSDSYNIWNAIEMWGSMKEKIKNSGATLVIRPDSGDPIETPIRVVKKVIEQFGSSLNKKGYMVLPSYVRVIQGDGVNIHSIGAILKELTKQRISTTNITFGMGGALLQEINRDTLKFAMKCSAVKIGDEWQDVFKDPITDKGKGSKKGRLALVRRTGMGSNYFTTVRASEVPSHMNQLQLVYHNGKLLKDYTFEKVRQNAAEGLEDRDEGPIDDNIYAVGQ